MKIKTEATNYVVYIPGHGFAKGRHGAVTNDLNKARIFSSRGHATNSISMSNYWSDTMDQKGSRIDKNKYPPKALEVKTTIDAEDLAFVELGG